MNSFESIDAACNRLERSIEELISILRDGTWIGNREAYLLSVLPLLTMERVSTRIDHLRHMEDYGLVNVFKGVWTRTELGDETLHRRRPDAV